MNPFTTQELRKGFSAFATGVTVITCLDAAHQAHGITISSFNTVSLEPPLILWSLKKHSRLMPNFEVGHPQLIHVLERSQESMALHLSKVKEHQFVNIPHQLAASGLTQIDGCVAYYECETVSVHTGGDHNIIVAKVLHLKHHPDRQPLIYAHSQFLGLEHDKLPIV